MEDRNYVVGRKTANGLKILSAGGDIVGPGPLTVEEAEKRKSFYKRWEADVSVYKVSFEAVDEAKAEY